MTKKSELRESINKRIGKYERWIESAQQLLEYLDHIPDMDGIPGEYSATFSDSYQFKLPWDNQLVEKAEQIVSSLGWELIDTDDDLFWGNRTLVYIKKVEKIKLTFRLKLDDGMEGATCVITKIGEKTITKQEPIYEVTCPEGAEVMAVE